MGVTTNFALCYLPPFVIFFLFLQKPSLSSQCLCLIYTVPQWGDPEPHYPRILPTWSGEREERGMTTTSTPLKEAAHVPFWKRPALPAAVEGGRRSSYGLLFATPSGVPITPWSPKALTLHGGIKVRAKSLHLTPTGHLPAKIGTIKSNHPAIQLRPGLGFFDRFFDPVHCACARYKVPWSMSAPPPFASMQHAFPLPEVRSPIWGMQDASGAGAGLALCSKFGKASDAAGSEGHAWDFKKGTVLTQLFWF